MLQCPHALYILLPLIPPQCFSRINYMPCALLSIKHHAHEIKAKAQHMKHQLVAHYNTCVVLSCLQLGSNTPLARFTEHTAAVKAIAWSPHQHGLLASGGGTADRCIRFWNTSTSALLNTVDTGSQVGTRNNLFQAGADGYIATTKHLCDMARRQACSVSMGACKN